MPPKLKRPLNEGTEMKEIAPGEPSPIDGPTTLLTVDSDQAVRYGLVDAGRVGRILRNSGAGPDHPVHPALPESAYLKALTLMLD